MIFPSVSSAKRFLTAKRSVAAIGTNHLFFPLRNSYNFFGNFLW